MKAKLVKLAADFNTDSGNADAAARIEAMKKAIIRAEREKLPKARPKAIVLLLELFSRIRMDRRVDFTAASCEQASNFVASAELAKCGGGKAKTRIVRLVANANAAGEFEDVFFREKDLLRGRVDGKRGTELVAVDVRGDVHTLEFFVEMRASRLTK